MIIDNMKTGGLQRRFLELLKELGSFKEISCLVVVLNDDIQFEKVHDLGYETIILRRKRKKDIGTALKLISICRSFKPDILHAWGSMSAMYTILLKVLFRRKMVNSMISNAPHSLPFESWFRMMLSKPFSNVILANSLAGLKAYKINSAKGRYIHNGVDLKRFDADALSKGRISDVSGGKKVIAMTGSFDNRKDFSTFVKAARIVLANHEAEFWAIGNGPLLETIKLEAGEYLNHGIYFPGNIKEVEKMIMSCYAGVLATYTEGISNSLIEFMALSKPVIATDGGGTNELVIDGKTGFLIPEKNAGILAEKVILLIDSPELCQLMGAAGRKRIEEEFTVGKMTRSFYDLYFSLLKKRGVVS
jgi:glycosyltransferase involved in cell wall biosynthesis